MVDRSAPNESTEWSGLTLVQATALLEANEQLVLGMLRAQTDAESAARAMNEVSRSAELDGLTELPNRALLLDRLMHAVASARRRKARLALLFLDLDNFKQVNDTLGHAVGDKVLKRAADCLASSIREADTVSRHGGDEFIILLSEVSAPADAERVARKVIGALSAEFHVDEHALRLSASIGISVYPDDGEDAETLIDRADAAMYRAKRQGRGGYALHGEEAQGEGPSAMSLPATPQPSAAHDESALAEGERQHALLRDANEQLLMAALNAQELLATAQRSHRQQTEFLAVLAHELRNPLTPIRTAAALLDQLPVEELPRLQAIIERQVRHMSRLVGDLLDVSRASTGKLRLDREVVDMSTLVSEAIEASRPMVEMREQKLVVTLPEQALCVHGDPIRLAQILSNLLDNASKYTPNGGDISLSIEVVDDAIVLTVSDTGIGISAAALPTVFEPFVQDSNAIGFNRAGLGIGLTVVRELVEAHVGTVVARSAGAGLGSELVVTLPLAGCQR